MEKQRQGKKRHLVVVPAPLQGHLTPMLQLASILHSNGFSITIAHTLFNSPDPSNHPNFQFLPFSDGLSHQPTDSISSHNISSLVSTLAANCVSPFKQLLLHFTSENNIDCIIYDGFMYFVESVAQQLCLPTLLLRTTSLTNVLAYHYIHRILAQGCLPLQDESVVPELEPLRFKDLPTFNFTNSDVLQNQLNIVQRGIKSSVGVIFNTADCLESQRVDELRQIHQVPIFPIGPFHSMAPDSCSSFLEQDYSCMKWLNEQAPRSVVYVSLGSIITWEEKELTEMAHGLANSKHRFLWVVRGGRGINVKEWVKSLVEEVREAIEERGCVVRWAPQKEVLAHVAVGGFWSHCGWNSTLESLYEGKPVICQACFGDQRVNSRLVSHVWKVGVEWSCDDVVMDRREVEKAVTTLMADQQMWERAQELKRQLRQSVTQGGSSHEALLHLVDHILSIS
ncbi:hypothetical protein K1719_036178 [Acacia pycnantha]|nr:hypothetical protein K1719_036178 [Acacia pycnantha]